MIGANSVEHSAQLPSGNWAECSTQNERRQVWCRTFRSKKIALNVRHHFHTLEYFIITVHFSAEKMYDEFPFVLRHLPPLEWHEPRRFLLARTLKAKFDHWSEFRRTF